MKFKPANSSENPPVKNTKINLFEAFAGVGSQHMALKNISKAMSWDVKVVGIVEWFIDAIVAYEAIHNDPPPPETILIKKRSLAT